MAIPTFGEFISGSQQPSSKPGTKPTKTPTFAEFLGSETAAIKEPKKPTLGGSIVRGVTKPFVRYGLTVGRAAQALTRDNRDEDLTAPVESDYYGTVKPLGQEGTFGQRAKDVLGNIAEIGSYAVGAGAVGGVGKTALIQLAKEGAISGIMGMGGAEAQKPESTLGSIARESAIGGVVGGVTGPLTAVGGKAVGRLFGKGTSKTAPIIDNAVENVVPDVVETTTKSADEVARGLTKETGKDIREVMEELSDAGFNKDQITKTMDNLYGSRPDAKRFTDDEITREAIKVQPDYYKPYIPPDQLPTIGFDAKTKSTKTFKEFLETPKVVDIPEQIPTTQPIRKNVYEFNENQFKKAEDFVKKVDPEFESGSMPKYKESFSKLSRQDLVDISTGVKKAPEDIPSTVVKALTKELPDLTKTERNRLAKSTFVQSKAGSELAGAKYLTDEVINDPYVYAGRKQKELVDKALKKGYTKNTIIRFLDDLEC